MTSTAVAVSSWSRARWKRGSGMGYAPGPLAPGGVSYSGDANAGPINLTVEAFFGNLGWTDISQYCYYRDMVKISRGRPNETSTVPPQTANLTINNRDGRFSPRNPTGPYFGNFGRNTPIRISRWQNGTKRFRYYGEVPSWPITWDISGKDVYLKLNCAGQLRRAAQGNPTQDSPMYRAYAYGGSGPLEPVCYWPCEDISGSSTIASGLSGSGALPINFAGSPNFGNNSIFPCSKPLPTLNGSIWQGFIPPYTGGNSSLLRWLMAIPATGMPNNSVIVRMFTLGAVARVDLVYTSASSGQLTMVGYDGSGTQLFTTTTTNFNINGTQVRFSLDLRISGSTGTQYQMQYITAGSSNVLQQTGTLSNAPTHNGTSFVFNPNGTIMDTAIGHISYEAIATSLFDLYGPLTAWFAEDPEQRFVRLANEGNFGGLNVNLGQVGNITTMGDQPVDSFPSLIGQVPSSEMGLFYESQQQLGMEYRSRMSLYNQGTKYNPSQVLTLDYSQHQLSAPLNPVEDDLYTSNDVTVTRVGSTFARYVQTDGNLTEAPPPVGVGEYQNSYSLSLGSDTQILDQAGWRVHMGTVDQPRFPTVSVNLRHSTFQNNQDLMNAVLGLDIGDLIVVNSPPAWMPPDPIKLIVQGYSESMGVYEHDIVFTCSPEQPYEIAVLDDPVLSRADTDGTTLNFPLMATDTVLSLATAAGDPLWTSNFSDFPFDVGISGERITVSGPGSCLEADPFLLNGISDYAGGNATISMSPAVGVPVAAEGYSTNSILVTPAGSPATYADVNGAVSPAGSVALSTGYTVWAWVYSTAGRNYQLFANWMLNNVYVSNNVSTAVAVPAGVWTLISGTLTSPSSGINQADWGVVDLNSPTVSQTFYVWGLNEAATASIGSSSPQSVTGIRSVNGVSKSQLAGTDVRLWQPMILSL